MSAFSRFITFFNNVIVGHEKGEENNLEKALATIESTNVMDAVNAVLTNEISNYENNTIQTITSEQTIEVDCGSYRLTDVPILQYYMQYTVRQYYSITKLPYYVRVLQSYRFTVLEYYSTTVVM